MTGMGEEVYIDHKANREAVLDELVAESQRLGLYDTPPRADVDAMVEAAAKAIDPCAWWSAEEWKRDFVLRDLSHKVAAPARQKMALERARSALESLGIPLSVLAAIRAGEWVAVPVAPTEKMMGGTANTICVSPNMWDLYLKAAPKTPEAER